MYSNFTKYWNLARGVVVGVVVALTAISVCYGHGFAPTLDVKGPSKEGKAQEKERKKKEGKAACEKLEKAAEKEKKGEKLKKSEKPTKKDIQKAQEHNEKHVS